MLQTDEQKADADAPTSPQRSKVLKAGLSVPIYKLNAGKFSKYY